jgi:predicted nucleic acid-binding protein
VEGLDEGEIAAIALATSLPADLLLMDDRKAVITRLKGLRVTGTLGVLDVAAERGLVDFA